MRMKMLVALCGMFNGEPGAIRPGQAYDAASDDEARRLYQNGDAVPWDDVVPAHWNEAPKAKAVSQETVPADPPAGDAAPAGETETKPASAPTSKTKKASGSKASTAK